MIDETAFISSANALIGTEVLLPQMLEAREKRVFMQQKLIGAYGKALISFTLNIPGPIKVLPLVPDAFQAGVLLIEQKLHEEGFSIVHKTFCTEATGLEAIWAVDGEKNDLKAAMVSIEDGTGIGRIFDIDIIGTDGEKVSRKELGLPVRKCLLCDQPAHGCARNRTHQVDELVQKIETILRKELVSNGV